MVQRQPLKKNRPWRLVINDAKQDLREAKILKSTMDLRQRLKFLDSVQAAKRVSIKGAPTPVYGYIHEIFISTFYPPAGFNQSSTIPPGLRGRWLNRPLMKLGVHYFWALKPDRVCR